MFSVTEYNTETAEPTGVVEYYATDSVEDAKQCFIQYRQLSDGRATFVVGPTGRVLYRSGLSYVFAPYRTTTKQTVDAIMGAK